jgi:hypothetical protein
MQSALLHKKPIGSLATAMQPALLRKKLDMHATVAADDDL